MNVIKLDRRYTGYGYWTHRSSNTPAWGFEARQRARLNYFEQRCFLTTQFGAGCFVWEASSIIASGRELPVWAFDNRGYLFLKGDALTTFLLTEGRWS